MNVCKDRRTMTIEKGSEGGDHEVEEEEDDRVIMKRKRMMGMHMW